MTMQSNIVKQANSTGLLHSHYFKLFFPNKKQQLVNPCILLISCQLY